MTAAMMQVEPADRLTVYWGIDPEGFWETDWLRELFPTYHFAHAAMPGCELPSGVARNALFITCNPGGQTAIWEQLDAHGIPFGLIHLSDEMHDHDVSAYSLSRCRVVWRNIFRPGLPQKTHFFPLGYKQGMWAAYAGPCPRDLSAQQRDLTWSFVGSNKADRALMISELSKLLGVYGVHHNSFWNSPDCLSIEQYRDAMLRSVFAPSPAGNWNLECFRTFEALECGCIPVTMTQGPNNPYPYYERLLGEKPPWICAGSWQQAAIACALWLQHPRGLETLRVNVYDWWCAYKKQLAQRILRTCRESFR